MRVQSEASIRNASITAGVGLLLMSALSGFGNFVAVVGLVTQRDAAQTAKDITASEWSVPGFLDTDLGCQLADVSIS